MTRPKGDDRELTGFWGTTKPGGWQGVDETEGRRQGVDGVLGDDETGRRQGVDGASGDDETEGDDRGLTKPKRDGRELTGLRGTTIPRGDGRGLTKPKGDDRGLVRFGDGEMTH